ncbi:hypothetical protein Mapa_010276 [Marchantia paleacea]|nr:hypothetical protein Mapa_010276 [Marchantia paleacea]
MGSTPCTATSSLSTLMVRQLSPRFVRALRQFQPNGRCSTPPLLLMFLRSSELTRNSRGRTALNFAVLARSPDGVKCSRTRSPSTKRDCCPPRVCVMDEAITMSRTRGLGTCTCSPPPSTASPAPPRLGPPSGCARQMRLLKATLEELRQCTSSTSPFESRQWHALVTKLNRSIVRVT